MRRRRRDHDEQQQHDAWAIPYGDLMTLLLAFFVVMYATSSVNEGKYRILSQALSEAFGGPVQVTTEESTVLPAGAVLNVLNVPVAQSEDSSNPSDSNRANADSAEVAAGAMLDRIADDVARALAPLLKDDLVAVRRHQNVIEIEIRSDVLFPSGSAEPSSVAFDAVQRVAAVLRPLSNPVRIEGHTDNQPIRTRQFPSNWELSAARAASVVREFVAAGMAPERFAIVGFGEYRPIASNAEASGRNSNRRVVLSVFSDPALVREAVPLMP